MIAGWADQSLATAGAGAGAAPSQAADNPTMHGKANWFNLYFIILPCGKQQQLQLPRHDTIPLQRQVCRKLIVSGSLAIARTAARITSAVHPNGTKRLDDLP
jgi:hypothetical protein